MLWRSFTVSRQELVESLRSIRDAGGTVTSCVPLGSGYRLTYSLPTGWTSLGITALMP